MSVSIRPENSQEMSYNIERDLAYLGPLIFQATRQGLDKDRWDEWFEFYVREKGISELELAIAFYKFAAGASNFTELRYTDAVAALTDAKFSEEPPPIVLVVMAVFGWMALTAYHKSVSEAASSPVDFLTIRRATAYIQESAAEFLARAKERHRG